MAQLRMDVRKRSGNYRIGMVDIDVCVSNRRPGVYDTMTQLIPALIASFAGKNGSSGHICVSLSF